MEILLSTLLKIVFVLVLVLGLVPVLIGSWLFELTPEGLAQDRAVDHDAPSRRDAARRLDRVVIVTLAVNTGIDGIGVSDMLVAVAIARA